MLRQGQNEQALGVFRSIYERTREPRALWRMATAEAALGRWVEAEGHMSSAFGSTSDAWIRAERAGLEATLRQVQARVGLLTVRCNVAGASIEVDGRAVTSFPLRVVAGDVRVRVRAEGYQEAEATVSVPGSVETPFVRQVELLPTQSRISADSSASRATTTLATAPTVDSPSYSGAYTLIGVGAAAAVAGAICYGLMASDASTREATCPGGVCPNADAQRTANALEDERIALQTAGGVLVGVGAAALVGGVIWRLAMPRSQSSAARSTVSIVPYVTGHELGLRGVF